MEKGNLSGDFEAPVCQIDEGPEDIQRQKKVNRGVEPVEKVLTMPFY
jgi:hypothetical protein